MREIYDRTSDLHNEGVGGLGDGSFERGRNREKGESEGWAPDIPFPCITLFGGSRREEGSESNGMVLGLLSPPCVTPGGSSIRDGASERVREWYLALYSPSTSAPSISPLPSPLHILLSTTTTCNILISN